jgi:hypothetical protein
MSGAVTYEGQPIPEGLVVVSNSQAGVYLTAKVKNGSYEIKTAKGGIPPGEYRVAITPPLVDHPVGPILERPKLAKYAQIPNRYRDESTSNFTAQLKEGENVVDFNMTK